MRIAMISTPFVPVPPLDYGGTELVVFELVEGLIQRGHDVTLYATGDSRTRARLRALYPRAQWPPDPLTDLDHVSFAMRDIVRGGYDLVHAHSAAALALGRLTPEPLIYTLHHTFEPTLSEYYRHFPGVEFVAISSDQAGRESGVRRCSVIHHGLDPARYRWTDRPGPYVCFVGRFASVKGLHTAIDAAARAGVPIQVAGAAHPPDREYLRAEVEPRLRARHVTSLGPIGAREKSRLLRDARALLAPIEWNEPFGLILAEALLSGCPVVAFGRGSVPELIEDGVTGFIVGSEKEITDLIRPGGEIERLDRRKIREVAVRRFGRDRMVTQYEVLYGRMARSLPLLPPISAA
ncbi:MAG: glycosyltransferase family 4 protein [Gemmatimonadales bacterium]